MQVITAATVRLDLQADRDRLTETVAQLRPRMLVLDPFVRLHRIDENHSGEVAPLLAYLRELQRAYCVAVVVVHHAKKGAAKARAGQALRDSSEFHAWGDSNLYLRRSGEALHLSIEHRAAASRTGVPLRLVEDGEALALEVVEPAAPCETKPPTALERVADVIAASTTPLGISAIRDACHIRTQTVSDCLGQLVKAGRVVKTTAGYSIPAN